MCINKVPKEANFSLIFALYYEFCKPLSMFVKEKSAGKFPSGSLFLNFEKQNLWRPIIFYLCCTTFHFCAQIKHLFNDGQTYCLQYK